MESVLLLPFLEKEMREVLSEEAREELRAILALCERVLNTDTGESGHSPTHQPPGGLAPSG
jgi:hypothetical protein